MGKTSLVALPWLDRRFTRFMAAFTACAESALPVGSAPKEVTLTSTRGVVAAEAEGSCAKLAPTRDRRTSAVESVDNNRRQEYLFMAQPTKEQAILICCGATMVRQEVVPKTWAPSAVKGPQMDPIILEGPVRVRWWLIYCLCLESAGITILDGGSS